MHKNDVACYLPSIGISHLYVKVSQSDQLVKTGIGASLISGKI